jgi:hypothetical protein
MVLAGLAAGCELVAGIQDKYLTTGDAASAANPPTDTGINPADDSTDAGVERSDASVPATGDADATVSPDSPQTQPPDDAAGSTADANGGGNDTPPDAGKTDPSAPCTGQPAFKFCDDFDHDTTVGQKWEYSLSSIDGGSSSFYTGAYTSSPQSLQIIAPVAPSTQNQLLGVDLNNFSSQIRLAFDLRVDMDTLSSLPTTCVAQILGARQGTPGTELELDYLLRPNQGAVLVAYVSEDGGPALNIGMPAPPLRTWTRIVVVYDVIAGITVYEDGVQVGANASGAAGVPNDTKIQVGMIYEFGGGSATLQMEMDNIVVRGN